MDMDFETKFREEIALHVILRNLKNRQSANIARSNLAEQTSRLIYFFGPSRVGKTTVFSYLDGFTFEYRENAGIRELTLTSGNAGEIGHGLLSTTREFRVRGNKIDCPGWFDNRDDELSMNLAFLLCNQLTQNPASIVFTISITELSNERSKLKELLTYMTTVYGSREELIANRSSFLILITKIEHQRSLRSLESIKRKFFVGEADIFRDNVITYTPTNSPYDGALNRDQLETKLNDLSSVEFRSPTLTFNPIQLQKCSNLLNYLRNKFEREVTEMTNEKLQAASNTFFDADSLSFINHPAVRNEIDVLKENLLSFFLNNLILRMNQHLKNEDYKSMMSLINFCKTLQISCNPTIQKFLSSQSELLEAEKNQRDSGWSGLAQAGEITLGIALSPLVAVYGVGYGVCKLAEGLNSAVSRLPPPVVQVASDIIIKNVFKK